MKSTVCQICVCGDRVPYSSVTAFGPCTDHTLTHPAKPTVAACVYTTHARCIDQPAWCAATLSAAATATARLLQRFGAEHSRKNDFDRAANRKNYDCSENHNYFSRSPPLVLPTHNASPRKPRAMSIPVSISNWFLLKTEVCTIVRIIGSVGDGPNRKVMTMTAVPNY